MLVSEIKVIPANLMKNLNCALHSESATKGGRSREYNMRLASKYNARKRKYGNSNKTNEDFVFVLNLNSDTSRPIVCTLT